MANKGRRTVDKSIMNSDAPIKTVAKPPAIFSFFSGLGFLDLGFERAGFEVAFVNEFQSAFLHGYKSARKSMQLEEPRFGYFQGDISELTTSPRNAQARLQIEQCRSAGQLVGFIGGPPCPDFSVGGKNKGKHGENGKLSATYIDLICDLQPDFFLFENVKGLWQTKRHREFFEELKRKLHANGFVTSEKLVNALDYGAGQDRSRILMFGVSREYFKALEIPIDAVAKRSDKLFQSQGSELDEQIFNWHSHARYNSEELLKRNWPTRSKFEPESKSPMPDGMPKELTVQYWFDRNDVEKHPNSSHCFVPRAGLARFLTVDEGDDSRKSYKRLHRWRYSPTACYGNNEVHLHPFKPRRLSVAEALSLQTLPKDFVLPPDLTLSAMFKGVGNGVPFVAANAVAKTIFQFFESNEANSRRSRQSDSPVTARPDIPLHQPQDQNPHRGGWS